MVSVSYTHLCEQVGFYSEEYALPEQTSQEELMQLLDRLNADPKIHGILVPVSYTHLRIRQFWHPD